MVRIKVIKASRLLAVAAAVLLAAVLCALLVRAVSAEQSEAVEWNVAPAAANAAAGPLMPLQEAPLSGVSISVKREQAPETGAERPMRILIYHTHTCEAYAQTPEEPYVESEPWRTEDPAHSVVAVGEALARQLRAYGCEVTHDTTNHEPPDLETAYDRSLDTLLSYAQRFDLYIDLHRDAYAEPMKACVASGTEQMAEVMFLIGRGEEAEQKPDFEANYAFAVRATQALNEEVCGLCRPVLVRGGRYNQHVGTPSVLIEVGHNRNTLRQALASTQPLAEALWQVLFESRQ